MLSALLLAGALLSTAATSPTLPPTPRFRHYGVSDGLPSSRVYTTAQDHKGYIWVGTGDGLARFDGQQFRLYRHDPEDARSLPGNDVSVLQVDEDGRIWVGGEGNGLNRLDDDGSGFRHWLHNADKPDSLSGNDVMGLTRGADGRIWVGVYAGGLNRLKSDGSGFDHWRHNDKDSASLVSDDVVALHAGRDGRIWVGTDKGLDLIESDGRLKHILFAGMETSPWIWQIRGEDGDIRLATSAGLFRVGKDDVARRWPASDASQTNVFASVRDSNGNVWVGERGSLRLFSATGKSYRFKTRPMLPGGLPGRIIVDIEMDREGGLWISSTDAGLQYLSPDWRDFSRFAHIPEDPTSLRSSKVMAMAATASGKLLVGGLGGQLDILDPLAGDARHPETARKLPITSVLSLATDGDSRIWIGMQRHLFLNDGGMLREVTQMPSKPSVRKMVVLDDHTLLAAPLGRGVVRVNPGTLAVSPVKLAFDGSDAMETRQLQQVGDVVWRASSAGLSGLLPDGAAFQPIAGVPAGRINAFAMHGQQLWLARSDVLEQYRIKGSQAVLQEVIGSHDGFPSIDINRIFIDTDGRVWMTSRVGLWRYDPRSREFRRYGVADGLPSPEFTDTLVRLKGGTVYAGTLGGVVGFRPASLHDHARKPLVVLEDASVLRNGKRTPLRIEHGKLRLAWDDSNLRVVVKALSYINPARNHYRFRMRGFDSGWVATGTQGAREFTGLGAGSYRLDIEAAGTSGAWSPLQQSLDFEVAAPPWDTPLAWFLYVLAALAMMFMFWHMLRMRWQRRMELRLLNEQRRLAEEANAAKTRFLATMGHEIRTPMTGVLGMAELLTHTRLDADQADMVRTIHHSGEVLLKLVNDALDLARIEAGRFELEKRPLDPVALMHEVAALESGLASNKGIDIKLEHSADVPARVQGDAIRLRQILLNLLSNALKFSEKGHVSMLLDMHEGMLRFRVSDSGPGMDGDLKRRLFRRFEQGDSGSNSGGSGLGLAICKELSSLMGGRIAVESEPGVGSTFTVLLPLPACAAPQQEAVRDAGGSGRTRRVLLVEDDETVARVISGLLREQGHEVHHADNALAALSEIDHQRHDILLIDIDLPDLDGFELIRILRTRPDGRAWRIVVVTARSNRDDETRAHEAGADAFLRKPVTGQQLRMVMEPGSQP
ncbi:MAG: two-component regulator propeller domain-containing protein [Rhodanobacteraceae bacterium]